MNVSIMKRFTIINSVQRFSNENKIVINDSAVFFSMTAVSLWTYGDITGFIFGALSLVVCIKSMFLNKKSEDINFFQYILAIYVIWIIISVVMHYAALKNLAPGSIITQDGRDTNWGIWKAKSLATIYLFFPVLLFILTYLFQNNPNPRRWFLVIPFFFLPSLLVAMYQGLVDMEFMYDNAIWKDRVNGLVFDANGFGVSLFLYFPLCLLGIVFVRTWLKRTGFILLGLILLFCLFLNGSRSAFLGFFLFFFSFPIIWMWAAKTSALKIGCTFGILVLICSVAIWGSVSALKYSPHSLKLTQRLYSSLNKFKEGGLEKLAFDRIEFSVQACRLTRLSPISGWGPGGFYRNLQNIRFAYKDIDNARFNGYDFIDNANNHYLQQSSELGILGAVLNFLLHFLPLWMIFRVRKKIRDKGERLAVGTLFSIVCIMLLLYLTAPYLFHTDVLWIFSVYMAYLYAMAIKYGYSLKLSNVKLTNIIFAFLTIAFIAGTYFCTFGEMGYKRLQQNGWSSFKAPTMNK